MFDDGGWAYFQDTGRPVVEVVADDHEAVPRGAARRSEKKALDVARLLLQRIRRLSADTPVGWYNAGPLSASALSL